MGKSYIEQLPFSAEIKEQLQGLIDILLAADLVCNKIVLFGSYARAEQKITSDFDILVLTDQETPREIRGELCSVFEENNADLIFFCEAQFYASDMLLVKKIKEEGVLLWEN